MVDTLLVLLKLTMTMDFSFDKWLTVAMTNSFNFPSFLLIGLTHLIQLRDRFKHACFVISTEKCQVYIMLLSINSSFVLKRPDWTDLVTKCSSKSTAGKVKRLLRLWSCSCSSKYWRKTKINKSIINHKNNLQYWGV